MPVIDVNLEGDDAWTDLRDKRHEILHLSNETWYLTALEGGMTSGKTSLALRLNLPPGGGDGASVVIAETSLAAWIAATCALRGRFPDAFAGTPLEVRARER
jgi:hypothetical protein